jgi:SOS response regulatory protein OraA/RecX
MAAKDPARRRSRMLPGDADAGPLTPEQALKDAYAAGLRLLARRELSESRLRDRLAGLGLPPDAISGATDRLRASGALDDTRAVRACARTIVIVKQRGRARAVQELQRLGFSPELAASAVDESLPRGAESALLQALLTRQLRGRNADPRDPAVFRRVYASLVRRGFSPSAVQTALRQRAKGVAPGDLVLPDDPDDGG